MVSYLAFAVLVLVVPVLCHPTVYRMKDNKVLEADLIPVSSTVIPLQVYKVGYGLNVTSPYKRHKVNPVHHAAKPLTAQVYKKFYYGDSPKAAKPQP